MRDFPRGVLILTRRMDATWAIGLLCPVAYKHSSERRVPGVQLPLAVFRRSCTLGSAFRLLFSRLGAPPVRPRGHLCYLVDGSYLSPELPECLVHVRGCIACGNFMCSRKVSKTARAFCRLKVWTVSWSRDDLAEVGILLQIGRRYSLRSGWKPFGKGAPSWIVGTPNGPDAGSALIGHD